MGFFDKNKKKWWDKKGDENNPLVIGVDKANNQSEEYFMKQELQRIREENERQMNLQHYGTASTPKGLYGVTTSTFGTGFSGNYTGYTYAEYTPNPRTQAIIDFFSKILLSNPKVEQYY